MVLFEFSTSVSDAISQRILQPEYDDIGCVRLLHNECSLLRIDKFGPVLAIYWYPDRSPLDVEVREFDKIANFVSAERWILYPKQKQHLPKNSEVKEVFGWQASEHGIIYELRANHGSSPGLFLDQRQQRLWALQNSMGKRVLNLFCYTSGFTLNALKGGATQVCSVDISASALAWSKINVLKNNLDPEQVVFLKEDSRRVLKRSSARGVVYDVVVCDPPTFSRGKGSVFSLKREFARLLYDCSLVVAPGGYLLFSTNFEGMSRSEFEVAIREQLGPDRVKEISQFEPTYDYFGDTPWGLKSCLIAMRG
jgi:23S rRNA (cytosine1962-C5)-methyltransferase